MEWERALVVKQWELEIAECGGRMWEMNGEEKKEERERVMEQQHQQL